MRCKGHVLFKGTDFLTTTATAETRGEGSIAKKDHKVCGAKVPLFVARRKEELTPLTWTWEYKMQ